MTKDLRGCYNVIIACHPPVERDLADAQVVGDACIRCNGASHGELIPVGIIVPPVLGSGLAMACEQCAPALFTS